MAGIGLTLAAPRLHPTHSPRPSQSTRTATHRPLTEDVTAPAHLRDQRRLMVAPFERIPVAPLLASTASPENGRRANSDGGVRNSKMRVGGGTALKTECI